MLKIAYLTSTQDANHDLSLSLYLYHDLSIGDEDNSETKTKQRKNRTENKNNEINKPDRVILLFRIWMNGSVKSTKIERRSILRIFADR